MNEFNNKTSTPEKYTVNISEQDLKRVYLKEWVLMWCEKYHPEAFIQGDRFLTEYFKNKVGNSDS